MTVVDLLSDLRRRDVKLWADGDKLRYNAPEGVLTPSLRAGLAERKAEILEFLQRASIDASAKLASVPRVSRERDLPLSFQQQQLWLLDQFEPDNPVYNVSEAVRIGPGLNLEALQRTLDTIVRRHEALRTTYRSVQGF